MVVGAVRGEVLQIKNLTHADADHGDHNPVPGLAGNVRFIWPNLAAPGIRADRGDVSAAYPVGGLKPEAWRFPARVAAPITGAEAAFHVPRADDDKIAALYLNTLIGGTFFEFGSPDPVAVLQGFDALMPGHIEKHSPPDHSVLCLFDTVFLRAIFIDQSSVVPIPHFFAEENVAQCVPLRAALQWHADHVIRVAQADRFLAAGYRVRPGRQHRMNGIEAIAPQTVLRAVTVKIQRQRENFPFANEPRGIDDILRRNVVERTDLVVGPPTSPILQSLRRSIDVFERYLRIIIRHRPYTSQGKLA